MSHTEYTNAPLYIYSAVKLYKMQNMRLSDQTCI